MDIKRSFAAPAFMALLYFAGAALSVHYSRFNGGVAMIWISSAILVARLMLLGRSKWPANLAACFAASIMATGLFGLGWAAAVPLALINIAEAVTAAFMLRRLGASCWPDEPFELVAGYYLVTGLMVPAASAVVAGLVISAVVGLPFETNLFHWFIGHAGGLIALLPICAYVAWSARKGHRLIPPGKALPRVLIIGTMIVLTCGVFLQPLRGLLLLPLVFTMFTSIWAEAAMALLLPVILAAVGGTLTINGFGPLMEIDVDAGDRIQAFELFVAITMLCTLPIVVEQERRRRQFAELSHAAMTDPLTGLANRRTFFDALEAVAEQRRPACLAILDIDHFKQINDRYGHLVGDQVLKEFAAIASLSMRPSDRIARIGGEEFAVLLLDVTIEQAQRIGEKLGASIAEVAFHTTGGTVGVTVSTGVAALAGDADAAFEAADRALYRAKSSGRSRLAVAA